MKKSNILIASHYGNEQLQKLLNDIVIKKLSYKKIIIDEQLKNNNE